MVLIRAEIIHMSKFKPGAVVSYLRSLVVRALHRHRKGLGSIPAGGPIVDDVFLNCSWLEFRHVYDFHSN